MRLIDLIPFIIYILFALLAVFFLYTVRADELAHRAEVLTQYQECKEKVGGTPDGVEWCVKTLKPYFK